MKNHHFLTAQNQRMLHKTIMQRLENQAIDALIFSI